MTWLGLALFAAATAAAPEAPLLRLIAADCPPATRDESGRWLGGRAMLSDDGRTLLVQCGDGSVRRWREDGGTLETVAAATLFDAARQTGLLPAWLPCPWPAGGGYEGTPECRIVDRSGDGAAFIVENEDVLTAFVAAPGSAPRELSQWHRSGALWPRRGTPTAILAVDSETRPERLVRLDLGDGPIEALAAIPARNLIFEDGAGNADRLLYSEAHGLLLVSFTGFFRVAEEMTYVRAYTPEGKERWHFRGPLPERDESLIVGDIAQLLLFDGGRHGVLGKDSDRSSAIILDIATGAAVGALAGWPIAASAEAGRVLLATEALDLVLVEFRRGR